MGPGAAMPIQTKSRRSDAAISAVIFHPRSYSIGAGQEVPGRGYDCLCRSLASVSDVRDVLES